MINCYKKWACHTRMEAGGWLTPRGLEDIISRSKVVSETEQVVIF